MLINKLSLDNYGVFYGRHEFILNPEQTSDKYRPIILFGGMNGSGKTTIFDAIKLCLYGPDTLSRNSNGKYNEYLKDRIHNSKELLIQPNYAVIEVEFQHSKFGEVNTYFVKREWENKNGKINEYLNIKKNGIDIDDVERKNWQDFVKELIPYGLSRLFFFDGEKIQKMMSEDSNEEFKKSIKSLIGLDLIERLSADIKIYRTTYLKDKANEALLNELASYTKEIESLTVEKIIITEKKSELNNSLLKTKNIIAEYESKLAAQGGGYWEKKNQLSQQKSFLESDLEILREKIRELCTGLLPIAIASDCAGKFKNQIAKENEIQNKNAANKIINEKIKNIFKECNDKTLIKYFDQIDTKYLNNIKNSIKQLLDDIFFNSEEKEDIKLIHRLSSDQSSQLIYQVEHALKTIPEELNKLTNEYELKFGELQKIQVSLHKVPAESLIRPMHEKLNELNRVLGNLENENKHLQDNLDQLEIKNNEIVRKKRFVETKLEEESKKDTKLKLVNRTDKILSLYYNELAKLKSSNLETEFIEIFSQLHRKKDMIHRIEIMPQTFDIILYDRNDKKIEKRSLSSGELEIFAMSMLWSLARISGQKLPFIIDTPLGRLDSSHRDNLLHLFFPYASHQMIIFSTDTEVDKKNFDILRPFISKCYILKHSDLEKQTVEQKGYFWN